MKCNCIRDLEDRLLEKVKESNKFKNLDDVTVKARNMAFMFKEDGKMNLEPYMEFEAKAPYKAKSGNERVKREVMHVSLSYCPFCGKKL